MAIVRIGTVNKLIDIVVIRSIRRKVKWLSVDSLFMISKICAVIAIILLC